MITNAEDKYGPNTEAVEALIERVRGLTDDEVEELHAARKSPHIATRNAVRQAAYDAARDAAYDAALRASWEVGWYAAAYDAAYDAILALVVRDIITPDQFDILYGPWASVMEVGE